MKTISPRLSAAIGLMAVVCVSAAAAPKERPVSSLDGLAARVRNTKEPAVLFVGNSYSFSAPKAFRKLAEQRGKRLHVEQATTGGWTLAKHAANETTLRKIREGRWDVIVFQEQSRIPSLPSPRREAAMSKPLGRLVAEARAKGAIPVLYQTWGYRDGDPKHQNDDFHAMTRRLREGYRASALKAGNVAIVAVGDAWEREVTAGRADKLFMPDGSHPTPDGNALTARVFYDTFFPGRP